MNPQRLLALDVGERVVFTFLEAFIGGMMLSPAIGLTQAKAAAIAGVAAALSYFKSTSLSLVPHTITPASIVPISAVAQPAPDGVLVGITDANSKVVAVVKGIPLP